MKLQCVHIVTANGIFLGTSSIPAVFDSDIGQQLAFVFLTCCCQPLFGNCTNISPFSCYRHKKQIAHKKPHLTTGKYGWSPKPTDVSSIQYI